MNKVEGYLFSSKNKISLEIENGLIKKIENISSFENKSSEKYFISPALFDNQINGYLGIEFSKPDLSLEDMRKVVKGLRKVGVGIFLPTVITASFESLVNSFKNLSEAIKDKNIALSIPGFHLEGPYISPVEGYRGAHTLEHIRKPDWDEFQKINEAAEGKILQVTLAPEVEGAIPFIEKCVQNNIVISLGHHNATTDEIKKAVDAGAKTVTHLGNGLANEINRFKNPLWMQLTEDRLMSSIIVDGFHLLPEIVKTFYRAKGKDRLILTSDITMLAGLSPGNYKWDGKDVVLTPEGIIMLPEQNVFAGASLPLIVGVGNIMKFTGCSLKEAVDMATVNPAKLYGFENMVNIKVGNPANLVLFKMNNYKPEIVQTIISGEMVFDNLSIK